MYGTFHEGMTPAAVPLTPSEGPRAELVEQFLELMSRLRRRFARGVPADVHAEMGTITFQQVHALHAIVRHDTITMGELAGCLEAASLSSATQMADRLVKLGLVERMSDPDDRRLVRLALSPRGRELLEWREAAWRQGIGRALEGFTDEECATLVRLLERAAGPPLTKETTR
jgi:DNA-binding MarR family transcriptional regulator